MADEKPGQTNAVECKGCWSNGKCSRCGGNGAIITASVSAAEEMEFVLVVKVLAGLLCPSYTQDRPKTHCR
jgi:hypothetical protein